MKLPHYPPTQNVPYDLECEMNYTGGSYGVHRSGYQIKKVKLADGQVFTFGHNLERLNSILGIRYSSQMIPGLRDRSSCTERLKISETCPAELLPIVIHLQNWSWSDYVDAQIVINPPNPEVEIKGGTCG